MNYGKIKDEKLNELIEFIAFAKQIELEKPSIDQLLGSKNGKFFLDKNLIKLLTDNSDKKVIYAFETDDSTDYLKLVSAFKNVKKERKEAVYHISKFNRECLTAGFFVLYVGSKEKNLLQRMKQHLGLEEIKSRTVYSLYLNDWWPNKMPVRLKIWFFPPETKPEVLQLMEDALWEGLFPLFGKKGATFNKKRIVPVKS